jgi:hypothetical protein
MKKCIVTMTNELTLFFNITSKWNIAWGNRHNYEFRHCISDTLWQKPQCILSHMDTCQKLLYIDSDAILLSSIDPFEMFPSNHNLTFTTLGTSVNSGVIFVESTDESQKALEWWKNRGNGVCKHRRGWVDEQDCANLLSKKQFVSTLNDSSWNRNVNIFSKNNANALLECMHSANICHAFGFHFWCKHHKKTFETLESCSKHQKDKLFKLLLFK